MIYIYYISTTKENENGEELNFEYDTKEFDKVIFATGSESWPNIPEREVDLLTKQEIKFDRPVLHSSKIKSLDADITGKTFLFIGSGYSAEDLALSFIKRGANHIYVTTRGDNGYPITYTREWPMDKLTVLLRTEIKQVLENGKLKMGRMDLPSPAVEEIARRYYNQSHNEFILEDIDAVIFCTGYDIDDGILAPKLQIHNEVESERGEFTYDINPELRVDETIRNNDTYWPNIYDPDVFDPQLGRPLPSETYANSCGYPVHENKGVLRANPEESWHDGAQGTYNRHLISNAGLFYHQQQFETPLLDLDIQSAYILKVILGDIPTPTTKEEMFHEKSIDMMDWLRNSAMGKRYHEDEIFRNEITIRGYVDDGFTENRLFDCPYDNGFVLFKLFSKARKAGHPAGNMIVERTTTATGDAENSNNVNDDDKYSALSFTVDDRRKSIPSTDSASTAATTTTWMFSDRGVVF